MLIKIQLESNNKRKCFWLSTICTSVLLNCIGGKFSLLHLLEKRTSTACLSGSGLKDIFHWKTHLLIFARSELSCKLNYFYQLLWKQRCVCMFFLGTNRCHICLSLSDCNGARTHNHLVRKRARDVSFGKMLHIEVNRSGKSLI